MMSTEHHLCLGEVKRVREVISGRCLGVSFFRGMVFFRRALWSSFIAPRATHCLFGEFLIRHDARGIILKWGGTPCRIFPDDRARTAEIVGTSITEVTSKGDNMQVAPYIRRPNGRTADGILGAIK